MPRVKQFDEKEVLEKAMELFWKQGFHATSMQDLVSYLGINRASLYDTFGGKQQLFGKALDHYIQTHGIQSQQLLQGKESVKKVILTLLSNAIQEAISDKEGKGCFVVNTTTELANCDPNIKEKVVYNQKRFLETFERLLKEGQRKGEINSDKDPRALAVSLFIIFSGLRVVGKAYWTAEDLKKIIAPVLSMLD